MGRVARYKAKKHAKAPTSAPPETDRLRALAPSQVKGDHLTDMPRSMMRLIALKKRVTQKGHESSAEPKAGQTAPGAAKTPKIAAAGVAGKVKATPQSASPKLASRSAAAVLEGLKRRPKESLADFGKRVDSTMAAEVYAAARKATNKAAKRRAWNESKKRKKRDRETEIQQREVAKQQGETAFGVPDKVLFGDVAQAPPQIKAKPRHSESLRRDPLLLTKKLKKAKAVKNAPRKQQILDAERERVIAAYRAAKGTQ